MNYFKSVCKADLVKEFRKLAKALHPDNGGDAEEFKAMNAEFEKLLRTLPDEAPTQDSTTEAPKKAQDIPEGIAAAIRQVAGFEGVELEICGSWLWASGCTYPFRAELKAAGFRFSSGKKMWYWHDGEYHKRGKKMSMDEIRERHGSISVQTEARAAIA